VTDLWIRLAVLPSSPERHAAVSKAMFVAGAKGLHEDHAYLVTHLEPATDTKGYEDAVRRADAGATFETSEVEAVDWSVMWRDRIGKHHVGDLVIAPPWLAEGLDPAKTIFVEPAMAFGTGDHPTTRGVVRLMQDVIRPGDVVADLGSGSAVLAIAAAKLGARSVAAIELDNDAISNAEENVAANRVSDKVKVLEGDAAVLLPLVGPVRVVLANIISSVLIELLPIIAKSLAPDGRVILSGILLEERAGMLVAIEEQGWEVMNEDHEEQWWSVEIARA
jgi:ribosomal protein L11 methyltransferase